MLPTKYQIYNKNKLNHIHKYKKNIIKLHPIKKKTNHYGRNIEQP